MTKKGDDTRSPRVEHLSWGRMLVDGVGAGKDFKLWPGGGREWNWGETDTHHVPGIQPADVAELLDHGSRTVVLSRGMLRMLHTAQDTLDLLARANIKVHVVDTNEAVEIYNALAEQGEAVGGLFHSTC